MPTVSRIAPAALVLLAALVPLPAAAEEDLTDLDRLVIVASRAPESISAIPGTVWVVEREQLEQLYRAGLPFKEALAQLVPGLDIGPQGRTNAGQNLRGRGVLVMIDGVSLNSSRAISRQFDSIDPFNIERIEVLSGANAVYGGGATGGIINIVTRRGDAGTAFETELGARSGLRESDDHDLHAAQSIAGGNDWVHGRLAAAFRDNGAAYDANGDQVRIDITQTDLQYNRSLDLMGNLDFSFSNGQSLRLTGQAYDSGYDGDKGLYLGPNLAGALGRPPRPELIEIRDGFESDVEPRSRRWLFNADYHAPRVLGGQNFYLQAFTRAEKLDFHPFPGSYGVGDQSVPYYSASRQNTDVSGIKGAFDKQWGNFKLAYGLDYDHETFDAGQVLFDVPRAFGSGGLVFQEAAQVGRYPEYTIDGYAAFVQGQWQVSEVLSLNAGWRRQRMEVEVDDFVAAQQQVLIANGIGTGADAIPGGSNSYDVNLLNAGAVWTLTAGQQLWANYSEGFELPDPGKYYGLGNYELDGTHWTLLNGVSVDASPLSGIKTRQLELGWRRNSDFFSAQAAAFYAWSDRDIATIPVILAIEEVDREVRNYGLEAQFTWHPGGGWRAGGNLLAIRTELKDEGSWQRSAVTEASPSKLSAHAGWEGERFGARLQALHSFDLDDADGNELDGYTVVDLLGHWRLPAGRLDFGIQNLFDKDYTTIWGQRAQVWYGALAATETFDFRGRGRTFALTYSLRY